MTTKVIIPLITHSRLARTVANPENIKFCIERDVHFMYLLLLLLSTCVNRSNQYLTNHRDHQSMHMRMMLINNTMPT